MNCMEALKEMKDNQYDLAIVDPPYGIGEASGRLRTRKKHTNRVKHKAKNWDASRPKKEYWAQLFRISTNQIIWGANYFVEHLLPKMGWIYWDKMIGGDFSDGELAYTSFDQALKSFSFWNGNNGIPRIHPTQKPVKLYEWLLMNYAKEGDKILDTHFGSLSIGIACHNLGFDLDAYEIDKEYFEAGKKRLEQHKSQLQLWQP